MLEDKELQGALDKLIENLNGIYGKKLKSVILYGSAARGTATPESDIDIMILVDTSLKDLKSYEDKLTDVYLWMEGMEKTREIVLFLADFLPGSQLMEFFALDRRIGNLNPCIIVSGAVFFIALTTVIGLLRFRKKELQ